VIGAPATRTVKGRASHLTVPRSRQRRPQDHRGGCAIGLSVLADDRAVDAHSAFGERQVDAPDDATVERQAQPAVSGQRLNRVFQTLAAGADGRVVDPQRAQIAPVPRQKPAGDHQTVQDQAPLSAFARICGIDGDVPQKHRAAIDG
jgi:hypothetical protein